MKHCATLDLNLFLVVRAHKEGRPAEKRKRGPDQSWWWKILLGKRAVGGRGGMEQQWWNKARCSSGDLSAVNLVLTGQPCSNRCAFECFNAYKFRWGSIRKQTLEALLLFGPLLKWSSSSFGKNSVITMYTGSIAGKKESIHYLVGKK